MLPDVQELEDYWLQDLSLVEAITRGLASDASAIRREDIPAPSIETIADFWNQREGGNRKGSAILEDLCERQLKLRFDKVASARHAMAFLDPKASHEVRSSLTKAVSEALAKGQRQA
jgi:hypothetical protein